MRDRRLAIRDTASCTVQMPDPSHLGRTSSVRPMEQAPAAADDWIRGHGGPTRGGVCGWVRTGALARRWVARPRLAGSMRVAVFLGPVLTSIAASWVVTRMLPASHGLTDQVVHLALLVLVSTVVLVFLDRAARRLLPLATLLDLGLLFPTAAPSRSEGGTGGHPAAADRGSAGQRPRGRGRPEHGRDRDPLAGCRDEHARPTHPRARRASSDVHRPDRRTDAGPAARPRPPALGRDAARHRQAESVVHSSTSQEAQRLPSGLPCSPHPSTVPTSRVRCCRGSASGAPSSSSTTSAGTAPDTRRAGRPADPSWARASWPSQMRTT